MTKVETKTRKSVTLTIRLIAGLSLLILPQVGRTQDTDDFAVSPVLKITPTLESGDGELHGPPPFSVRSINGSFNNPHQPDLGAANTPLLRRVPADYSDGVSELACPFCAGAREISNVLNAQPRKLVYNKKDLSDYFWQWGQFLDHDIDLTDGVSPPEPAPIPVPTGDPYFDPNVIGTAIIPFNRSIYLGSTRSNAKNPRQQLNQVTSWIDASNVYGSDDTRANALRTLDGTGRLKTSTGDLLPLNTPGLPNAGGANPKLFLAGDVRANEQVGLTAMHTLFVREHNRLADLIHEADPGASDDEVYQRARRLVGAQMQHITYNEFLPLLLGPDALQPYQGYDPEIDPRVANVFSTAAYRFGHSALNPQILRLDAKGKEIDAGHLALRDAFFAPWRITEEGGIEPVLRGLAYQKSQKVDLIVIDDVRNFLFGDSGEGGFDLAALNIQRGRDHGLPRYNATRQALGLTPAGSFSDLTSDPDLQDNLAAIYADVDEIDLWIGGLAEDHWHDAQGGETYYTILKEQFEALRDGDRFWYERDLSDAELAEVRQIRFSDIIRRNTDIDDEIPDDVFHLLSGGKALKLR
jgi:peroxidase